MKKLWLFTISVNLLLPLLLRAHIGSPGVVMQGNAGPHALMVNVEPPDVIPGIAKVTVYTDAEAQISNLFARAVYFRTGDEGAPPADPLKPVPGQPGKYYGELWMMATGSSSIQIIAEGSTGKGEMIVPVVAVSTATKTLPRSTGIGLAALGVFLVILMMTIIGSSVGEALAPKGEPMTGRRKRNKMIGLATGFLACAGILYGGNAWWDSWAKDYRQFMYQPLNAESSIEFKDSTWNLHLKIDTTPRPRGINLNYLVPDHGKMMHMFIMRIPAMDAFAHLHPQRVDSNRFTTILPSLPKGRYLVFADIVYLNGFTETIKDTFYLKEDISDHNKKLDKDDAYAFALPANLIDATPPLGEEADFFVCGKPGTGVKLKDGSTMVWEGQKDEAMFAGKLYNLQFAVYAPDGSPAVLDPYLGMGGHAAVVRNDGNVYIHMHPSGTANMAAVQAMQSRIADTARLKFLPENSAAFRDSVDAWMQYLYRQPEAVRDSILMTDMPYEHPNADGMIMDGEVHTNMLQFPYVFPAGGQYRIWVQIKRNGQVLTAAFDKWID
jgi:hypothetical protein